eukprot:4051873-Pleurochrysis_carterae.AAC.1
MRRPGTKTWYAPGDCELRPRLTPIQARGSIRVLESADRGFTAKALQPKGIIPKTVGFSPVTSSNDVCAVFGGVVVRLRTSTACITAKSQKATGAEAATSDERANSIIERIARSATPLSS